MRLLFHIFKKDARRLWWAIALSVAWLAVLAWLDGRRSNANPGAAELALNWLLPAGWAMLIALLIHGEALVGDRQFWTTRPYPWHVLLGAKLLGLSAFVHLPAFAADCAIVAARGFNPLGYLPALLAKQCVLALSLTVPAATLATLTRNLVQFVPAAVTIAGAAFLADWTSLWVEPGPALGRLIPLLVFAPVACVAVYQQYRRRRTSASRGLAAVAVLVAVMTASFLPKTFVFRAQCLVTGTPVQTPSGIAEVITARRPATLSILQPLTFQGLVAISMPVRFSGLDLPPGARLGSVEQLALSIRDSSGHLWPVNSRFSRGIQQGGVRVAFAGTHSLELILDRATYDRIKDKKVSVEGKVGLTFFRSEERFQMPALAASRHVPGLGRCLGTTAIEYGRQEAVRLLCESPAELPVETQALTAFWNRNLQFVDGRPVWGAEVNMRATPMGSSARTWLSPMRRAQALVYLSFLPQDREADKPYIKSDVLSKKTVELEPSERAGAMILSFTLRDLNLQQYEEKSGR